MHQSTSIHWDELTHTNAPTCHQNYLAPAGSATNPPPGNHLKHSRSFSRSSGANLLTLNFREKALHDMPSAAAFLASAIRISRSFLRLPPGSFPSFSAGSGSGHSPPPAVNHRTH